MRDFVFGLREGMYLCLESASEGEEKKRGKNRDIVLRRVGRQAATTEKLHSNEDQYAAGVLSQVTSVETEMSYSALRRRMDVRHTKRPRQNTAMRAYFCLRGSRSLLRTGTGIRQITTSVMMLREALANQTPKRLRQWPPML